MGEAINHCAIARANAQNPTWRPAHQASCLQRHNIREAARKLSRVNPDQRRDILAGYNQAMRQAVEAELTKMFRGRA